MEFRDFLIQEYSIGAKSADDYISRFNGIITRGIYKGEHELTSNIKTTIENKFPNSKKHYLLTIERYIEFKKRTNNLG